jgi:hypothetical protein
VAWYGEVGMFAAHFCDLEAAGLAGLDALLGACEFGRPALDGREIVSARTYLPAPFGFQGFGVIDALIKVEVAGGAGYVIAVEGKRTTWRQSSARTE